MALKPIETSIPGPAAHHEPKPAAVSAAKLAANRRNARKSTGPRTQQGKARSSQNALAYGVFSGSLMKNAVTPDELSAIEEVLDIHMELYRPQRGEERIIVDRMASLWWRLARLCLYSQNRFHDRVQQVMAIDAAQEYEKVALAEARLERSLRGLRGLRKDLAFLQKMRLGHEPRWGADEETIRDAVASKSAEPPSRAEPPSAAAAGEAQPPQAEAAAAEAEPTDSQAATAPTSGEHASASSGTAVRDEGVGDEDAGAALEGAVPDGAPPGESAA